MIEKLTESWAKASCFEISKNTYSFDCFSLHDGQDVISHNIESPPGHIGIEPFGRQHSTGEVILQDIMNLFHSPTAFSLPLQQPFSIPTPHVRDDGKIVIRISVSKEFPLGRTNPNRQVSIRQASSFCGEKVCWGQTRPLPTAFVP